MLGTGLLLNGTTIILEEMITPPASYEIDPNTLHVNQFDRWCILPYSKPIDTVSTIFTYTAVLAPAVLLAVPNSEWFSIGTMYAESVMVAWGLKELGKNLIPRNRPYMYFEDYPQDEVSKGDFQRSFPSGHVTLAFTGATFCTYVFTRYFPDSPWILPLITVSYAFAVTSSILRVASGTHFLTDVITGAALGGFSGFIVPWLHTVGSKQIKESKSEIKKLSMGVIPVGVVIRLSP